MDVFTQIHVLLGQVPPSLPDGIYTVELVQFYVQNLRSSLFAGFLTLGGFLFSAKTFIVIKMKEGGNAKSLETGGSRPEVLWAPAQP